LQKSILVHNACVGQLGGLADTLPALSPPQANATGRSGTTLRQFLEKNYKDDMSKDSGIELAVKTLLEVVESGAKNMEIAVLTAKNPMEILSTEKVEAIVAKIQAEKAAKENEEKES